MVMGMMILWPLECMVICPFGGREFSTGKLVAMCIMMPLTACLLYCNADRFLHFWDDLTQPAGVYADEKTRMRRNILGGYAIARMRGLDELPPAYKRMVKEFKARYGEDP